MRQSLCEFEARVPAKLNLSLAVTGRRGALHTLDMIVCPWEKAADIARFSPLDASPRIFDADARIELADVAASFDGFDRKKFEAFFLPKLQFIATSLGVSGSVSLELGVPLGAGLGGSSAATVAVLKAAQKYLSAVRAPRALSNDMLLALGSDVPCMYAGGLCRVRGVGEIVEPLDEPIPQNIDVFIPNFQCDSAACYALYDKLAAEGKLPRDDRLPSSAKEALSFARNDLTLPAIALRPELGELLSSLRQKHSAVFMSGSGSALAFC